MASLRTAAASNPFFAGERVGDVLLYVGLI
jgi:hypothetical protein